MKNILVTGAGGGMGRAVCEILSKRGYNVYGVVRRGCEPIEGVKFLKFDVTDTETIKSVYEELSKEIDSLYAIVHTAGIYDMYSLIEIPEEELFRIFNINVFGAYRVNKIFRPLLKQGSRIVLTSSELAAVDPLPFTGIYGITKTTLERYAFSLRQELNLLGCEVSIIRPGAIETGLLNVSTKAIEKFKKTTKLFENNATKFDNLVNSVESKSVSPEKVAMKVVSALEDKHPRYIYNINRNPLLRMLSMMPDRMQVAVLGRMLSAE